MNAIGRTSVGLIFALVTTAAAAESAIEPDGAGRIQSMEAQTLLLDGQRFDVSGASVRQLIRPAGDEEADAPRARAVGTVSASRSVRSLVPGHVSRVWYRLRAGSDDRIRVLWIPPAPADR